MTDEQKNEGSVKGRPCSEFLCRVDLLMFVVFVLEFHELSLDGEVFVPSTRATRQAMHV
jgi:hypothetical protein